MSIDFIFNMANNLVFLGWILLLAIPEWKYSRSLVQSGLIPILLSVIYAYLIATGWGSSQGGFGSIEGIRLLFGSDTLLVAGWVHYLAFDLWLGSWEYGDAKKHGIHRLVILPCQLLTFFFGPIGLLLYLVIRTIKTKKLAGHENF